MKTAPFLQTGLFSVEQPYMPHLSRLASLTIVSVLLLVSCGGFEPEAATTSEPSVSTLAFEDANPLASTTLDSANDDNEDPTVANLRLVTKEDGACAVFDAFFDAAFSESAPLEKDSGQDLTFMQDPNFALNTVDDGPFGQAWAAHIAGDQSMNDAIAEELNQLSTEQCGYPVMDVFKAALQRDCLTPIDETTGRPGEQNCQPLVDPRP